MQFPDYRNPTLPVVTPFSMESLGSYLTNALFAGTSFSTANNVASFFPLTLEKPVKYVKAFTVNGGGVAGNTDIGIYDSGFNRIVSMGVTAQSGSNAVQEFDITDTILAPGKYWMAVGNTASGNFVGVGIADELILSSMKLLTMASAIPLPSTATPILSTSGTPQVPLFGFTEDTLI